MTSDSNAEKGDAPKNLIFNPKQTYKNLKPNIQSALKINLQKAQILQDSATEKSLFLIQKEKALESNRVTLEQSHSEFRKEMQARVDAIEKEYQTQLQSANSEIQKLKGTIDSLKLESVQLKQKNLESGLESEKNHADRERQYIQKEQWLSDKFSELCTWIDSLQKEKQALTQMRQKELQKLQSQQSKLEELSELHKKRSDTLNKQTSLLKENREQFNQELEQQYEAKRKELETDFNRKLTFHHRRLEEQEKDFEWVLAQKEALFAKEQKIKTDLQKKADNHFKKKQELISHREQELKLRESQLAQLEETLAYDKENLASRLVPPRGGKFSLEQLKVLIEEQKKINERRVSVLENLESDLKELQRPIFPAFDKDDKQSLSLMERIKEERDSIKTIYQRLKSKEMKLLDRENDEIQRLNQDFEDFKNTLEVDNIEKTIELEEARHEILKDYQDQLQELKDHCVQEQNLLQSFKEKTSLGINQPDSILEYSKEVSSSKQKILGLFSELLGSLEQKDTDKENTLNDLTLRIQEIKDELNTLKIELKNRHTLGPESKQTTSSSGSKQNVMEALESDLRNRLNQYQRQMDELMDLKENAVHADHGRQLELSQNLESFEEQLSHLGSAFDQLSHWVQEQAESANVAASLLSQPIGDKGMTEDEVFLQDWKSAIRTLIDSCGNLKGQEIQKGILESRENQWNQWVQVPKGNFWIGHSESQSALPYQEMIIDTSFYVKKYPVTNLEFFLFVQDTGYRTEAELGVVPIVFHKGEALKETVSGKQVEMYSRQALESDRNASWYHPNGMLDSILEKPDHPVTQITWRDAKAFCQWKSEKVGVTFRLPTEAEWEYLAQNFGKDVDNKSFQGEEVAKRFNIEESHLGGTVPVHHFPETNRFGGVQDLFGNTYEWVDQDLNSIPGQPGSKSKAVVIKGGSFICHAEQLATWKRQCYPENYCASFIGFRLVAEQNPAL